MSLKPQRNVFKLEKLEKKHTHTRFLITIKSHKIVDESLSVKLINAPTRMICAIVVVLI